MGQAQPVSHINPLGRGLGLRLHPYIFEDIDNMYRGRTVTLKISAFYHHIKHIVFTVVSFANVAWSSAAISAALSVQLNMFKSSFI